MSAAADDPTMAAARVSVVASVGYCAFLAGPPLVGFLGHQVGVLQVFTSVAALLAAAFLAVDARTIAVPDQADYSLMLQRAEPTRSWCEVARTTTTSALAAMADLDLLSQVQSRSL